MKASGSELRCPQLDIYNETQKAVAWDFGGSFMYSQGDTDNQTNILNILEAVQRLTWSEEMLACREAVMPAVQRSLTSLPPSHTRKITLELGSISAREIQEEYEARWEIYEGFVYDKRLSSGLTPSYTGLVNLMTAGMAKSDQKYINRARGRTSEFFHDPYTSHVREFILRGIDTKSVAFNYIFGLAYRQIIENPRSNMVEQAHDNIICKTAKAWEHRHPDQGFWAPPTGKNPFIVSLSVGAETS